MEQKKCTQCGKIKPVSEFYTGRGKCKKCLKKQHKEYYQKNKKRHLEQCKIYVQKNKKKTSEYQKDYHQKHRKKILKQHKQYYQKHKERCLATCKQYELGHKDAMTAYRKRWYLKNQERKKQYQQEYRRTHKEECREQDKRYRQTSKGKVASHKHKAKRYRNLGFNSLNKSFPGSVWHHINNEDVVAIPEEVHVKFASGPSRVRHRRRIWQYYGRSLENMMNNKNIGLSIRRF